jgi:hypothetical protein
MEILKHFVALAGLSLVWGCDPTRPPTPIDPGGEQVVVSSVLHAGSDTVLVSVVRVTPRLHSRETSVQRITGAEVRIEGEGVALRLAEAPPGFGPCLEHVSFSTNSELVAVAVPCYAAVLPGGVRVGGQYQLRISLPGGGRIEGAATVPQAPTILAPEGNARWIRRSAGDVDMLKVRWTAPAGTAGIGFSIQATAAFRGGARVLDPVCTMYLIGGTRPSVHAVRDTPRQDSASLTYDVISCTDRTGATPSIFRPDSMHARLVVTAYDTTYTRYTEATLKGAVRPEQVTAGISGALGVFAGVASAERRVTLIPEP